MRGKQAPALPPPGGVALAPSPLLRCQRQSQSYELKGGVKVGRKVFIRLSFPG